MQLINAAQSGFLTIVATVDGGGGDWGTAETYPVVLERSVTLVAPGVYFNDEGGNPELFDIAGTSADGQGYATIMGSEEQDIWIGVNQAGDHSTDPSTIKVEDGSELYLLGATVASSMSSKTTALTVVGGTLILDQNDESTSFLGQVTIGSDSNGWNGIVCMPADGGGGCTVSNSGANPVVIQGQQDMDIDAEDGSLIALGGLVIGFPPNASGFGECPAKPDTGSGNGPAVLLHGSATVSLYAATVQCIAGTGFELQASPNGGPALYLGGSTIQNTAIGIHATDGTVAIDDASAVEFNAVGVWQDQNGSIDLSGNGVSVMQCTSGRAGNTVACNFGTEIGQSGGGVSVRNTSSNFLNACGVAWDTAGPDLFLCDATYNNCTCEIASCTEAGGSDENMDAVYTSGAIITAGNSLSNIECGMP